MTDINNTKRSLADTSATGQGSNINELIQTIYHNRDSLKFGPTESAIKYIICHSKFEAALIEMGIQTEFYSTDLETKILSPAEIESSRPSLKTAINNFTAKYMDRYLQDGRKEFDTCIGNGNYFGELIYYALLARKLPNKSISEVVPSLASVSTSSSTIAPTLSSSTRPIQNPELVEKVRIFNEYWDGSFPPLTLADLDEPITIVTHKEELKVRDDWAKKWIEVAIPWFSDHDLDPPAELLAEANKWLDKKTETFTKRVQTSNNIKKLVKKCYANHYEQGLLDLYEKQLTNCDYIIVEHEIFTHVHQNAQTGFQNLFSAIMELEQPAYCTVEESLALVHEIYVLLYIARCMIIDKETYNPRIRLPEARRCAGGKLRQEEITAAGFEVILPDAEILALDIRRYESKLAPSWCRAALAKFNDMDQKDKTAAKLREIALFQNAVKPYIPKVKVQQTSPIPDAGKRQKTGNNTYNQTFSPSVGKVGTIDPQFYTPNKKHSTDENHPATKSVPEMRNGLYINAVTNQPFRCQTHRQDSHRDGPTGDCAGWWKNYNLKAAANNVTAENLPAQDGDRNVPTHITDNIYPHKLHTAEVINQVYTNQHKNPHQLTVKPCSLCAVLGDAQEQSQKNSHAAIECGIFKGCNCSAIIRLRQVMKERRKAADQAGRGGRGGRGTLQRGGRGDQQPLPSAHMTSLSLDEDNTKKAFVSEMDLLESRWANVPLEIRKRYESSFPPERLNSKSFTDILMNRFKPTLKSITEDTKESNPESSNANVEYEDPYKEPPQVLTPGRSNYANPFFILPSTQEVGEVVEDNKSETSEHHSDYGDNNNTALNASTDNPQTRMEVEQQSQIDRDNAEFNFTPSDQPIQSSSRQPTVRDELDETLEEMEIIDAMEEMDVEEAKKQSGDGTAMANMAGSSST